MPITWRIPAESFMDEVETKRFNDSIRLLGITDAIAIDSYAMGADGPSISSVFVLSCDQLIEIRLTARDIEFDICSAKKLTNYRIQLNYVEKPAPSAASPTPSESGTNDEIASDITTAGGSENMAVESEKNRFATVILHHSESLITHLAYFGKDLDAWLQFVMDKIPTNLVS
jgi:hypothetical protein